MLPSAHLAAAAFAVLMFVVKLCHAENVCDARFVSKSEKATAPASTSDVWRTLRCVPADGTKQNERRN